MNIIFPRTSAEEVEEYPNNNVSARTDINEIENKIHMLHFIELFDERHRFISRLLVGMATILAVMVINNDSFVLNILYFSNLGIIIIFQIFHMIVRRCKMKQFKELEKKYREITN